MITTDTMQRQERRLTRAQFRVQEWSFNAGEPVEAERLAERLCVLAQLMDGAPVDVLIDDALANAKRMTEGEM
jgi:hypothetical protein